MKILFAENLPWKTYNKVGSHHYAKLFKERGYSILWLSLPWSLFHLANINSTTKQRVSQWHKGHIGVTDDGILTYCPLTLLPFRNNLVFREKIWADLNLYISIPPFKKLIKNVGFDEVDILWVTDPRYLSITKIIKYKKLVYRCVDAFEYFSDIPSSVLSLEKELISKSDVVFATANNLIKKLNVIRPDIYSLPNGVNESFITAKSNLPEEYKAIKKPIFIYVGTIGEWFNVDLLVRAAKQYPACSFVMIGPSKTDIKSFSSASNIYYLGERNHELIVDYLSYADVGLIPFKINEISNAVNPLKLYEYFARGLPVISTNLHELNQLDSPALIASNDDDFIVKLEIALAQKYKKDQYIAFARENTWEKRMRFISEVLNIS